MVLSLLLLLLTLPAAVQAQFNYVTNDGTITITGYTGAGGAVTIPSVIDGLPVTRIGDYAFHRRSSLTSMTIGNSVTRIGEGAFSDCRNLSAVYFLGNAPSFEDAGPFNDDTHATVYYLPGTTGWGPAVGDRPAVLWKPQVLTGEASLGVRTNQFGFTIAWASGRVVVVEACADLANPIWTPVGTNTLAGGAAYFSDPAWTNYSGRFYRLRSP